MVQPVLEVTDLSTHFSTRRGIVKAVDGVTFSVGQREIVGLVGESGSGKSITGFSVLGLVDPPGRVVSGSIRFQGEELTGLPQKAMRAIRGKRIAMIFQDPMMTLNPVLSIGTQMVEAVQAHDRVSRQEARERSRDALGLVGIPSPEERLDAYPHQFSGGMRQRVAIAIALLHRPDLIIADEPTTALDVTIQSQILFEIKRLAREFSMALVWISHDLGVVAALADRVMVMYAGRIVEAGPVDDVLAKPAHPYTLGLMQAIPSAVPRGEALRPIPGMAPNPLARPSGCSFRDRCPRATAVCCEDPRLDRADLREWRCFHPFQGEAA
ncbi:ABC transporter ATP-binding protein [Rhizobium sp. SSA_523]|uniref:ABC transporter ATP-binding protein n=1 Tax=Rhizobium sp. SSA_523 TaxID=2952477 RepID=UPI0020919E5D|nr:ABC transporter ATP-binding protein [Rhizobium sp. SSA_523]MCO5732493.1 ABC transporter ATP-binding protein [Rhizobium sp. SSA_523]WKC22367.1 ABC transporter ATP-binding protein [Rhizobium sp. SSA_523]